MDMRYKEDQQPSLSVLLIVGVLATLSACGGGGDGTADRAAPPPVGQVPDGSAPQGDSGTIAFDVTPAWDGGNAPRTAFVEVGDPESSSPRLMVFTDPPYLRVLAVNGQGQEFNVGVSINNWVAGESHAIAVTWDSGVERVYVDGQLAGRIGYEGALDFPAATPLHIPSGTASVTDFHAYSRPLTPDEIAGVPMVPTPSGVPTPPVLAPVLLRVHSTGPTTPDNQGTVCVDLFGSDGLVAGTQNDLVWDPACMAISSPCVANPDHGKRVLTGPPRPGLLKTVVFSFTDTNPIADGLLYCCPYRLAALPSGSCCVIGVTQALGSDPVGKAVPIDGIGAQLCVP